MWEATLPETSIASANWWLWKLFSFWDAIISDVSFREGILLLRFELWSESEQIGWGWKWGPLQYWPCHTTICAPWDTWHWTFDYCALKISIGVCLDMYTHTITCNTLRIFKTIHQGSEVSFLLPKWPWHSFNREANLGSAKDSDSNRVSRPNSFCHGPVPQLLQAWHVPRLRFAFASYSRMCCSIVLLPCGMYQRLVQGQLRDRYHHTREQKHGSLGWWSLQYYAA